MSKKVTTESPLDIGGLITKQTYSEQDEQKSSNKNAEKIQKRSVKASKKKAENLTINASIQANLTKYNGSNETGKPIYFSENILSALRKISEKYHRRISVRAIAQAVLDTFINDVDGYKIIDDYMTQIGYKEPSAEKLAHNKLMAEQAKKRRAVEKNK